jgi:succinate dehydrogenase / fumarate reductase iron-sulfur subunit
MIVKIKRQAAPDAAPYWQSFVYDGNRHVTVSAVLDALNYTDDLFDSEGNAAPRIRWECSCLQSLCGGCAMVINGTPALACATYADAGKGEELVLEPLSKFPVVADLVVDRTVIHESLIRAQAFLDTPAARDARAHAHQYSVAKCLKCGLCLEVCPNYRAEGDFFGAVLANESYLAASQSSNKKSPAVKGYQTHFAAGCSKALSCESVCPMGIQTLTSILRMNRK